MRRLALVLLAGCWTGAAPPAVSPAPRDAVSPRARPPLESGLERGPCLGRCPEFELTIADDGHVRWWGKRNVAAVGRRTRRLAPADLDALDRELARAGFAAASVEQIEAWTERLLTAPTLAALLAN